MHRNGQRQNERKAHYANSRVVRCMLLCNLFVLILRFCILSFQICGPHSENCANFQGNTIRMQGDTHRINPKRSDFEPRTGYTYPCCRQLQCNPFLFRSVSRHWTPMRTNYYSVFCFSLFRFLFTVPSSVGISSAAIQVENQFHIFELQFAWHTSRFLATLCVYNVFLSSRRDCFVRQSIAIPYLTSSSDLYNQLRLI